MAVAAMTTTAARTARRRTYADDQDRWLPHVLILPVTLAVVAFILVPLGWGLRLSLTDTKLIGMGFTDGFTLRNYAAVLASPAFWGAFWVTLLYSAGTVVGGVALGLATALVLNLDFWGRGVVRTLIILPWAIPHVVAALIWQWMYNPDYGVINYAIGWLPFIGAAPNWLSNPDLALVSVILVNVWKTFPFAALIILAGLQTISDDMYEAADMDGAGPFRRFVDITLPGLRHVMAIVILLLTIWSFGNFVFIFLMTQGGPAGATNALVVKIYFEAFKFFRAGPAFAMGAVLLAVSTVLAIAYLAVVRRSQHD